MKSPDKLWWLLFVYALTYAVVMLSFGGIQPYEFSPYHRYQAEALLHGHLYLSDSIYALQPGLAWHNGQVQHVWGLGVGLWLLPFEAIWRLWSNQPFPDRIALGLTFGLLAFFSGCTGLKLVRQGQRAAGYGLIWLIPLCPALWTLARASQLVFEETVLYSIILSLAILVSLIRVVSFGAWVDYFLCCALSAFAIWVRPTHAVYGLAAVLLGSYIVWRRRGNLRGIILGISMVLVSIALLAWTNYIRFGSPGEFGHHLTVSSGNMMYLTRFGNPCREASLFQASRELFGLLFLTNPQDANAFADGLFPGQSPAVRWRKLDLTTFDSSFAALATVAAVGATVWLIFRKRKFALQPDTTLISALLLWSAFSMAVLFCFYLYYPAIASRYLLDFAPTFAGFVILAWILVPSNRLKFLMPLLATWTICEIVLAKVSPVETHLLPAIRLALPSVQGVPLEDFHGIYTAENHPRTTNIAGNGHGWEQGKGFAADVVSLVVDKPRFLELTVSERRPINGNITGKDIYQAQIDGISLELGNIISVGDQLKVSFSVPPNIQQRQKTEIVFLCFSKYYVDQDRNSERFLYSVAWR